MHNSLIKNIYEAEWEQRDTPRGVWRYLDISGDHLGLRIETLEQGDTSSIHHYHTLEEEHVIILEGTATLVLGADEHAVRRGDHVCFKAGEELAHHLRNDTSDPCTFLVIGERERGDVVVYPEKQVATVKALGWKQFDIAQRARPIQEET